MITNIFITFLNMSISAGIVALLLIVWRQLSQKYVPSKFYYLLWATVLLRLVVPFSFKSEISLLNLLETSSSQMQGNRYVVVMDYIDVADVSGKVMVNSLDIVTVAAVLWAVVVLAMTAVWIGFFVSTKSKLRYAVLYRNDIATEIKADFGVKDNIRVFKTEYLLSPMVLGFFKPKVIFSDKTHTNEDDFKFALAHEIVHIKRRDHFVKAVAYFALALHWYNPIVWICCYMLNEDIEKSCDEAVVGRYGVDCKKRYASALVNYADKAGSFQFGYISFAKKKVEERVHNILSYEKIPLVKVIIFTLVTVTIGVTVSTNPVLTHEYRYIPSTVYLPSGQRQQFRTLVQEFGQNVSEGDVLAITQKATADAEYFADTYLQFAEDDIQLEVGDIFYTSNKTADVHFTMTSSKNIVFPQGVKHLVAQIAHSDVMGGLYVENLHTYDDYNSFSLVDRENEAVQIVEKMIKYDITSGENTPQNAGKIVAFCMDMFYDRSKDKNIVHIPAKQVEDIAEEFFLITDCTNLRNTDYFNSKEETYRYSKNIGTRYEYKIMQLEQYADGAAVTVYFYKDPLQTQLEKVIRYKLEKERTL